MHEALTIVPREYPTTDDITYLIFGNGVHLELKVSFCTEGEREFLVKNQKMTDILPSPSGGIDVVNVHFLPVTSTSEVIVAPADVPDSERAQFALDCLAGFITLAEWLRDDKITIPMHHFRDDFYLFAETNVRFAAFLRSRCGFRGPYSHYSGATHAWVKKSEFASDENIEKMRGQYLHLKALSRRE
jgi:hypothetical protein